MRKTLVLIVFFITGLSVMAQSRIAEVNNNKYAIGIQFGEVGIGKSQTLFGGGINAIIWGVYVDFLLHPMLITALQK